MRQGLIIDNPPLYWLVRDPINSLLKSRDGDMAMYIYTYNSYIVYYPARMRRGKVIGRVVVVVVDTKIVKSGDVRT